MTLAELLDPITPQEFIDKFWGKRPLVVRGARDKFRHLIDEETFIRAASDAVSLRAGNSNVDRTSLKYVRSIQSWEIKFYYKGGATICAKGLDHALPHLAAMAASVKHQLGFTGIVDFRCYLSGHASGFITHFDARNATTLQVEGKKTWRFSRSTVEFPLVGATILNGVPYLDTIPSKPKESLQVQAPNESDFEEILLEPGDLLYLPPGTWHSAQAVEHSLSLNLALNYVEAGNTLDIIFDTLRSLLEASPSWRSTPPLRYSMEPQVGEMPHHVKSFFKERVHELRAVLEGLDRGSDIQLVWQGLLAETTRAAESSLATQESAIKISEQEFFDSRNPKST